MQGPLHAATIERRARSRRAFAPAMAIGEEQDGVAMHLPEAAQVLMGRLRQRDEAVLVALGVSLMHARPRGVDVDRRHAPRGAAHARGGDDPPGLLDGDDIGQALDPRWLDEPRRHPGLTQDVLVVELIWSP